MRRHLAALLLLLAASMVGAQDKKISQLPSGSPFQPTDMIPIARAGANFRLAASDFNRFYKTFTSATNFERLTIDATTDPLAFQIGSEYGSTGGSPRQFIIGSGSVISDVAPEVRGVFGESAWSQSAANTTGGSIIVAGGLGRRFYTIVNFANTGGKTVTLTANGTAVVLTEGVNFVCAAAGSNAACATNLAAAINVNGTLEPLLIATASSAVVYLDKKTTLYSLTIDTNAGGSLTATSNNDGAALFVNGTRQVPSIGFVSDNDGTGTGFFLEASANIGVSVNGGQMYRFGSGGLLNLVEGMVVTPTIGGAAVFYARQSAIEGSRSRTLADNIKTAFVVVSVPSNFYAGGDLIWTLYCADANDRVARSGRLPWSAINDGGTETCVVGTTSSSGDAGGTTGPPTFVAVTFTCADGGTNAIQLEVQADCSLTPTTLTIQYRLDMPQPNTVTPQ